MCCIQCPSLSVSSVATGFIWPLATAYICVLSLINSDARSCCNVTRCVAHVLSKLHLSSSDTNINNPTTPEACHATANTSNECCERQQETATGTLGCGHRRVVRGQVCLNEQYQLSRCASLFVFFLIPTVKCWRRARWQGWNEHSACYVPCVHCAAHTANPGPNIYSSSCVHLCMSEYVCVWLGKPVCGSESPAGVWGKKQQEAENPRCLWISVSKQEVRHQGYMGTLLESARAGSSLFILSYKPTPTPTI